MVWTGGGGGVKVETGGFETTIIPRKIGREIRILGKVKGGGLHHTIGPGGGDKEHGLQLFRGFLILSNNFKSSTHDH